MTSLISKKGTLATVLFLMVSLFYGRAQDMRELMGQSLSRLQQPTPEAFLTCIAELKRIEAMFPDQVAPKYQLALQSLNYAMMNPHSEQTESLLSEAELTIGALAQMPAADASDVCTLWGFLYMTRIVQDPARNGQRYYLDVIQNYEKALKANPDNALAKQLQEKFNEGMAQAMR
ncbi:MAG: hypothetical protein IKN00_01685 [Bacteroidales bacterium]|nr:hypothetical protein [Bacteroidales bacterium]